MSGCPVRFVFAILVAGVALGMAPRAAHAQSYGLGEQALHIGAADFRSTDPVDMPGAFQTDTDGYLWNHTTSVLGFNVYAAPLHLPTGAQVTSLCLYYFDQRPTGAGVSLDLHASKFVPGGQLARVVTLASVVSTGTSGYGVDCADVDPPITISDLTVLPGDATLDIVTYYVKAHVWGPDTSALGGVRIFWHRQVSPAPSVATFNDVPTSDPTQPFIEALFFAGITGGCGGSNFCPDAPLTRRQMAVFLAKALGLHWPI